MRKIQIIPLIVLCFVTVSQLFGEETLDKEKIIDVEKLKTTLNEATMPISSRLKKSKLLEQFKKVNGLLGEKEIKKELLLEELQHLKDEMNSFTRDFGEITDPLWKAEEKIGETVNKVRLMLARGKSGKPTKKVQSMLKNYDRRLSSLAKAIEKEKDESRRKRLRIIFANVLSLKELMQKSGSIDLSPASEAVNVKIIRSLTELETALTNAIFSVERTRVVLKSQSEWISTYCEILRGLIESENLANMLGQMSNSGQDLSVLNGKMGELNGLCSKFNRMMNNFASNLADNISTQTSRIAVSVDMDDDYINKKIKEYSSIGSEGSKKVAVSEGENKGRPKK